MKNYSVLITVHGGANPYYFDEALKSMVEQTVMPEQIVISVDGGITDKIENVILKYQNNYDNMITVVRNKKVGNWHAANTGLKLCRNEYIARMDSDDISVKNRCETELDAIEKFNVDIVGGYAAEFNDDIENIISVRKVPVTHDEIVKYAKKRNPFNHPSIMFKKSAAVKCGGYNKMKRCEDYDFVVRMIMSGSKCANIPETLLFYRLNDDTFKRRKNWNNTKGFIYVRYLNWIRGFSTFFDFVSVSLLQLFLFVTPEFVIKIFYKRIIRR